MKKTTMKENRAARRAKYGNKVQSWTINKIIKLAKSGKLVPAPIQRNVVTKKGDGITASYIINRRSGLILINKKKIGSKTIYEIVDGLQRIVSILLYVSGVTLDENCADRYGLKDFLMKYNAPVKKQPMAFSLKNMTEGWENDTEELAFWTKMADRKVPFCELNKHEEGLIEDILETELFVLVANDLSLREMISFYKDINNGTTKLTEMEMTKCAVINDAWEIITKFAPKSWRLSTAQRFGKEQLVGELFGAWKATNKKIAIDTYGPKWKDVVREAFVAEKNTPADEEAWLEDFYSEFDNFKKDFNEFEKLGLYLLVCHKRKNGKVEPALDAPFIPNFRALFTLFCENKAIFKDKEKNQEAYVHFLNEMEKPTTDASEYLNVTSQGTGGLNNFYKTLGIMKKYLYEILDDKTAKIISFPEEVEKAALTTEE